MQSKRIAVTGGIGSGKSALCGILKERGYPVFSCDEISKQLRREEEYIALLKEAFPDCAPNGIFSEAALSEKVFSDSNALEKLNHIAHPLIMKRLLEEMSAHAVAFAEVPLLYEGGFENLFDGVIAVVREEIARVASVTVRSGLSEAQVLARIKSQFDYRKLNEKKCFVIENDGSLEELKRKTEEVFLRLGL